MKVWVSSIMGYQMYGLNKGISTVPKKAITIVQADKRDMRKILGTVTAEELQEMTLRAEQISIQQTPS